MTNHSRLVRGTLPGPSFLMLLVFMAILLVAGGAARPDVMGQSAARGAAVFVAVRYCLVSHGRRHFWIRQASPVSVDRYDPGRADPTDAAAAEPLAGAFPGRAIFARGDRGRAALAPIVGGA